MLLLPTYVCEQGLDPWGDHAISFGFGGHLFTRHGGFNMEDSIYRVQNGGFDMKSSAWRVRYGGFGMEGSIWRVRYGGFDMEGSAYMYGGMEVYRRRGVEA